MSAAPAEPLHVTTTNGTTPSTARAEASRANGRLSRGPVSPEGKARSRQNGCKDGLTGAGIVLPPAAEGEVQRREAEFARDLRPRDAVERELVRQMALGSWRSHELALRIIQHDARMNAARFATWEQDGRLAAAEIGRRLGDDPEAAVAALERTSAGCDWLIGRWTLLGNGLSTADCSVVTPAHGQLDRPGPPPTPPLQGGEDDPSPLEKGGHKGVVKAFDKTAADGNEPACAWTDADLGLALDLLGRPPGLRHLDDRARRLESLRERARSGSDEAAAELREIVAEQVAELERRGEEAWEGVEEPRLEDLRSGLEIDLGPEGTRLRRYEAAAERLFRSAWTKLERLRKERGEPLMPRAERRPAAEPVARPSPPRVPPPAPPPSAPAPAARPKAVVPDFSPLGDPAAPVLDLWAAGPPCDKTNPAPGRHNQPTSRLIPGRNRLRPPIPV
jgi:hypothetical protein